MKEIVRLKSITINGIKNVLNGKVELSEKVESDGHVHSSNIIGIYGQNGSGKTAIIDSLKIIKKAMSGQEIHKKYVKKISLKHDIANLEVEFLIHKDSNLKYIKYILQLQKIENDFNIINEKIQYNNIPIEKYSRYKTLISSKKTLGRKSYIFNKSDNEFVKLLGEYANLNMTVVDSENIIFPLNLRYNCKDDICHDKFELSMERENLFKLDDFEFIKVMLENQNTVLTKILPELKIEVKEIKRYEDKLNQELVEFVLYSKNGDIELPLKYESQGIKKIISILNSMILVYHNPSFLLIVDDLDIGIFEYLLGEILDILHKYGKGQLIFTSHNLRPLEVLKEENLIFTTTNKEDNYTRFSKVKVSSNIRNIYMKSIMLGHKGKDDLYLETDIYEIKKAFRKAERGFK